VADELSEDGLLLRYRVDETDDGFTSEEGTFTICSFWLVSALVEIGEPKRARRLCEKLLSLSSALGLYGEQIDHGSGRHLGNFPQAFTHLALINAVMHLIDAERGAGGRAPLSPPVQGDPPTGAPEVATGTGEKGVRRASPRGRPARGTGTR
jgi:hypothetical protein